MRTLYIYNSIAYCLSLCIVLSKSFKPNLRKSIVLFVIFIITSVLAVNQINYQLFVFTAIATVFYWKEVDSLYRSLYRCSFSVFIIWFSTAVYASAIMMFFPIWHGSTSYNIVTGIIIVLLSLVLKKQSHNLVVRFEPAAGYVMALIAVVLSFFQIILPYLFSDISSREIKYRFSIIMFSFLTLLLIVSFLVYKAISLIGEILTLKNQIKYEELKKKEIKRQFDTVLTLRHYYNSLFTTLISFIRADDMVGLKGYFDKHIAPIHQENILPAITTGKIKDELLRSLIEITATNVSASLNHVLFEIKVDGTIHIPENLQMPVFECACVLIDNAVAELTSRNSGMLLIHLHEKKGKVSLQIQNTVSDDFSMESLGEDVPGKGYGLKLIRKLCCEYRQLSFFTKLIRNGDSLLMQEICIMEEDS